MTAIVSIFGQITRIRRDHNNSSLTLRNQDGLFNVRATDCLYLADETQADEYLHIGGTLHTHATRRGEIIYIKPLHISRQQPDHTGHLTTILSISLAGDRRCFVCPQKEQCQTGRS